MPEVTPEREGAAPKIDAKDNLVLSRHTARLGEAELRYTVTAGTVVLREPSDKDGAYQGETPKAEIFFVAYVLDDPRERQRRPITFSFNGGPGSSSVWLHLGVLGPKRVQMMPRGDPTPPPYQLVDNAFSLLPESDLVFIDPVSTGYSRVLAGEKASAYHELRKDVESVAEFIRLYTSRTGRWLSPKFLIGESYGTTRAAALAQHLQARHGLALNGIMLVSSILDFQTARFEPGNDLPYLLFLPSYTATAHYHGRLPKALQARPLREVLSEVEGFAMGEYALALLKGSSLAGAERDRVRKKLARYTGLAEAYLEASDLRIEIFRFAKALLRDVGRTVGRLDSRFTGFDRDSAGERFEYDPSYAAIQGPYTATFNDYVRRELRFESDRVYEILTDLHSSWRWSEHENRYVNVAEELRRAMSQNPYLKVHVASGYYDLATPYFATTYTLNHLGLAPELRSNLSSSFYEAGHMMYTHGESLARLKAALSGFVRGSSGAA